MDSYYNIIDSLEKEDWKYYDSYELDKVFVKGNDQYIDFIFSYFKHSGKVNVLKDSNIKCSDLHRPDHICSVFFLGVILYNKTCLSKEYPLSRSHNGYLRFPYLWFLIALFHDNAYKYEKGCSTPLKLKSVNSVYKNFNVKYKLLKLKHDNKCDVLLKSRTNYYKYRFKEHNVVDHGILAGILLYDKLCKIRKAKEAKNDDGLFWGKELKKYYKIAANAISIHNIWVNQTSAKKKYEEYSINELNSLPPISFNDFPLFYILAVVDTIEPIKAYSEKLSNEEILNNLNFGFHENGFEVYSSSDKLDINLLHNKCNGFKGWLDIDVQLCESKLIISYK